jgi:hypothetical protein
MDTTKSEVLNPPISCNLSGPDPTLVVGVPHLTQVGLADPFTATTGGVSSFIEGNMTRQARWARKNYKRLRPKRLRWERKNLPRLMFNNARIKAKRLRIPFTITLADIYIPPRCPILGIPLRTRPKNRDFSPSLDRKIPVMGYVPGNVFVISNRANRIKSDANPFELRLIANYANNT